MHSMQKTRLDILLVERGLVPSRELGQAFIMAGKVRVAGELSHKPSQRVATDADITVDAGPRFVSRGGYKLEAALDSFELNVAGVTVADVGASTGGFTDCLLQREASRVYAIDVGYGQLAWALRQDPRVVVMERTNARYLSSLPEPVDLVTVDASFISLKLLLPTAAGWLRPNGQAVALIKPQFEAGKRNVGKGGVVRDPAVHREVLVDLWSWATARQWGVAGLIASPVRGPAGNVEFLIHLKLRVPTSLESEPEIERALAEAEEVKSSDRTLHP
jgi:23S rRNA (cytidine1920-2'-O)/16S rRNA (cytidine1409-2'-O)-methyltransferase